MFSREEYEIEQAERHAGWLERLRSVVTLGRKRAPKPQVVVYGHDSKSGLQMHRWSKGLDSGCIGGGKLTALIMDAQGKTKLVQVGCKDYK